jgi:predicted TIM-barrel fold metal-dependent hydrolase
LSSTPETAPRTSPAGTERAVKLVDADIHPAPLPRNLAPRLDEPWRTRYERYGVRVANPPQMYPRVRNSGYRVDSWPDGGFPGSDLGLVQAQLLDEHKVDHGVLIPLHGHTFGAEAPEFAAALCHAVNEWVREEMLDPEPRLSSSINVALETPELAVEEIERYAGDPRFVQVLLPTGAEYPLGNRKYWPIYAAAAEAGLPLVAHTGGFEQHRGTGWPSFYLEAHVFYANAMMALPISLISEGVFQRFPGLQVVLVEAGISWSGPLMWSMDAAWSGLRDDVPHLERKPSEEFREHFWFTTQPIEEPDDPQQLVEALEFTGMTDRIMFASDYPHWDFDSPAMTLPRAVPKELRAKIMAGNACRLYGFGPPPTHAQGSQPPGGGTPWA